MVQSIGGLLLTSGFIAFFAAIFYMNSLNYPSPPFPAGFLVGLITGSLGVGITVGSSIIAIKSAKQSDKLPQWITIAILAAGIAGYGINEILLHPLELPPCPCPTNYYGEYPCLPCPMAFDEFCGAKGVCDDGIDGKGICFCEIGWGGDACDVCSETFKGEQCDECKRGWTGDNCDRCYPGYNGTKCDVCSTGWVPETDKLGTLCRFCEPGYWGGYCEPCQNCTTDDPLAVCKDNDWHRINIYDESACTPSGDLCSDKYDCNNFNCKGICVVGDTTTNQICEFDGDCGFQGECQYKQCCLEARHGNGHCDCGSVGYWGEDCAACPGFDGVYSATVCTGHGTCASEYADGEYVGLRCECTKAGITPFPAWSGETCSCLKDTADATTCSECAEGSFGLDCQACPGGSGIGQCNIHGKCDDGIAGSGTCSCDVDVKYGGLGAFKGASCDSCLSNDFYGNQCKICPNLQVVQCDSAGLLAELPGVGQCVMSCGVNTCNTDTGICF